MDTDLQIPLIIIAILLLSAIIYIISLATCVLCNFFILSSIEFACACT